MSYKNIIRKFTDVMFKFFLIIFCCIIIVSFEIVVFKKIGSHIYKSTLGRNIGKEIFFLSKVKKTNNINTVLVFLKMVPEFSSAKLVNETDEYDCIIEDIFRNENEDRYILTNIFDTKILKNEFTATFKNELFISCKKDTPFEKIKLLTKFFK